MLISYRGHMGERDPWQTQGGMVTEPLLRALGIPIWHLTDPARRPARDSRTRRRWRTRRSRRSRCC